jgi:Zn-dependent protease with chaperone function
VKYTGQYYLKNSSKRLPVALSIVGSHLHIQTETQELSFATKVCLFETPISKNHMIVVLPDGSRIEVNDAERLHTDLQSHGIIKKFSAFHLEKNFKLFLISLGVLIATIFFIIKVVIPASSKTIAHNIPLSWAQSLDSLFLSQLDNQYLSPSEIPDERKQNILRIFAANGLSEYKIEFRKGNMLKANAFALTGDTMIFTDELVNHITNDYQLLGIALHEKGHLIHRHVLQGLVRGSAITLLTLLMGDLSGSPEIVASLGLILVSRNFQRDQESDADNFAAEQLKTNGLSPLCFSLGLQELEKYYGLKRLEKDALLEYLSTHPDSDQRIQAIKDKHPEASLECGPSS